MGFLDKVKELFVYTGENNESTSNISDKAVDFCKDVKAESISVLKNCRINLENPIELIKNSKDNQNDKKVQVDKNKFISEYSKNILYSRYYSVLSGSIDCKRPYEEIKLLLKRFLEDKVIDDECYSDEDILYIKELVSFINSSKNNKNTSREEIVKKLSESDFLVVIIEILDIMYGSSIMDYCVDSSYIICNYYFGVDADKSKVSSIFNDCGNNSKIVVCGTMFIVLEELKSVINESDTLEKKNVYINNKLSSFFYRYLVSKEDISDNVLNLMYDLFIKSKKEEDILVDNNIKVFTNSNVDTNNTTDSINDLKIKSIFDNICENLLDINNNLVTCEEIEDSINEVESLVNNGYVLTEYENSVLNNLKVRKRFINT